MNTKITKTIVALSIIAVLTSISPAAVPMAEKVPGNAMVYVGWAGQSLTFKGSMFGQLLNEPGVKELFGTIKTAASKALEMTEEQDAPAIFDSTWAMAAIAWQKPAAVALLDIKIPRQGGKNAAPAAGPKEPTPEGFILIDLQKDKAAFDVHFQKLLGLVGKKAELSQVAIGNLSYHSTSTPAGPCSMGYVGNFFFLSIGDGAATKIASVVNGKSKSLANSAKFAAAMKEVAGQNVQMAYYVDLPRLLTIAEKLTPKDSPDGQNKFRGIIKAIGIDGVTAIAGASNIVDRGFHEKCRIFSPAPHRGVLMPASGKPLGAGALAGIPADADLVVAMNIDPVKVLAEIKQIASAIDPNARKELEEGLSEACEQLGLDVDKDLLAHMGDQWTLISAPSLGGTITGTVLTVQLKDATKFSASLAKIEEQVGKMIAGNPNRRRSPRGTIRKYKSGEVEVHYVSVAGSRDPIPVAPAWAVHKGKLYLAAFPQVIAAAVGGTKEKPLTQSPAFAALRKRVSPNASILTYTNTPSLVRQFYGAVLAGGTAGINALGKFAPSIKPEMLPPLPKVEKYIWADISAVSSDAKGITIESYGSMPGGGLLSSNFSPLRQALATSIALPALWSAKRQARQAVSMANLKGLGLGITIYTTENNDNYPPGLIKLVETGSLPAEMLMSPNSGRKVRKDSKGKPIPPFDYVYLGAGLKTTDIPEPAMFILAYERPEINKNKGTNVLYADCHVAWVSMAKFHRDLAKTQKWVAENNK
ncbi:MAG: DUF3352 domain-containing protein [Phycisphaerae bacterium]|nr:DUF3352 domain-containing protein [Phycisphaerae bacterium]